MLTKIMNKPVLILLVLILLLGIEAKSQIIKGEAILGLNLTQVEGDEVVGFKKPGLQVGAGALIPIAKKWDITLEVLFNQKGAKEGQQYLDTVNGQVLTGAYKLNLNYVEVPVLVQFTDKQFLTFGAGLSWGRLVGVKEWEHGNLIETTTPQDGPYSQNDFSYLVDIRVKILGPLKFGIRYQTEKRKGRLLESLFFSNEYLYP
jgi:hypothetical protein